MTLSTKRLQSTGKRGFHDGTHTHWRTLRLRDWISPVGRFSKNIVHIRCIVPLGLLASDSEYKRPSSCLSDEGFVIDLPRISHLAAKQSEITVHWIVAGRKSPVQSWESEPHESRGLNFFFFWISAQFVQFSAKFWSWNVQIWKILENIIFIACKLWDLCKYYISSMIISCSTCQKEEK